MSKSANQLNPVGPTRISLDSKTMEMVAIGLSAQLAHLGDRLGGLTRRVAVAIRAGWLEMTAGTARNAPAQRTMAQPAAVRPLPRLDRDEQWSRLTSVLGGAVQRATDAGSFHAAAEQQLDLAHYALCNLMDELSAVMAMPARRGPAVVRVLEPRPQRFIEGAWAA